MPESKKTTAATETKIKTKRPSRQNGRPRGRPRSEDSAQIESKLLEAGLKEFLEYGYGDAAMDRIAKAAGGSKTTLYSRYPSKEDLFRAIMFRQVEHAHPEAALKSGATSLDLEQGLKSYANRMLEHSLHKDMIGINRLLQSEAWRFPELAAAAREKTSLGIRRISDFITQRADEEGIPCSKPEVVAETFIFLIRGWYTHLLMVNQEVSEPDRKAWVAQAVNTLLQSRRDW